MTCTKKKHSTVSAFASPEGPKKSLSGKKCVYAHPHNMYPLLPFKNLT